MPRIAFSPSNDAGLQLDATLAPPTIVAITVEQHAMLRAVLRSDRGTLDARSLTELLQIARAGLPETGVVDVVKAVNAFDSIYVTLLLV